VRITFALGIGTGAIALILAGCSGSTNDTQTDGSDATEDVAAKNPIRLACNDSAGGTVTAGHTYLIKLIPEVTSIKVEAIGAPGGSSGKVGGTGGYVGATIPNQAKWQNKLYASVGCQGGVHSQFPDGGGAYGKAKAGGGSTSLGTTPETLTPLVIAGGGGGVAAGGPTNGGSVKADGTGQNGSGSQCGGGGATQSRVGAGGGKGNTGGKDGNGNTGGNGGTGQWKNGGGGGGGFKGGGGGCGGQTKHGSGGAGSSWFDTSATKNGTYNVPKSNPQDGSIVITFNCTDSSGSGSVCGPMPVPTPIG
jgi:hypothetical protein